jgi:hypothetical protein
MDEAKAKDLIQFLIQHNVALTPTYKIEYPGYPRDWARFEEEDRALLSRPDISAYYPPERVLTALGPYSRGDQGAVRERRMQGFQNALRFHKMFVDAGGRLIPGANTNATKVPGQNLFHEFAIHVEGGVTPMQIIQGATKWSAEMIDKRELGTVEAGKIADVIIVNRDSLQNVQNLRDLHTVIFDGKAVELGYNKYSDPFLRQTPFGPPVERLPWVAAYRRTIGGGGGQGQAQARPAGPVVLPDPVEAPQPAIDTITPLMVTEGGPTATVTLKGFNFVRRSQVLFKGASVPFRVVSPNELQVTIDAGLLKEPGWFDLVVKNPWPIAPAAQAWGDGTSNKARLIVNYRY